MNYFVWIVALTCVLPNVLAICPSICRCTHFVLGLYDSAECSNLSLTELPSVILDDVLGKLDLSFNKITVLKNNTFLDREISYLDKLMLNDNQISTIEVQAFRGMKHLTYLNVRNNDIADIHAEVFKNIQELRILNMNNNPRLRLPETGFHLPSLSVLDMSTCGLQSVPDNFFLEMKSLDILTLDGNQLTSFDPQLVAPLTKLEYLDLRGNRFTHLQDDLLHLPHTLDIELKGNPFRCGCDFIKAYNVYKTRVHHDILACQPPDPRRENVTESVKLTDTPPPSNVGITLSAHILPVLVFVVLHLYTKFHLC